MADDGWDVFGDADDAPVAPVIPPSSKRPRVDPLAPFLNDDGSTINVPPPPPPCAADSPFAADALSVWPDHPPHRLGPLVLANDERSGRGFIAARDVAVGEILMVEAPAVHWPDSKNTFFYSERGPHSLIHAVLSLGDDECRATLAAMKSLHPTSLAAAPNLPELRKEYDPIINALLPLWRDPGPDTRDELLRLCLTVRWNAFDSGLFLHHSIFNHAPSRRANCDKAAVRGSGGEKWSVVRATRWIPKGAQCLISYVQPAELSAASSRQGFLQFDFDGDVQPRHPEWDRPPRRDGLDSLYDADMLTRELEEETYRMVKSAFSSTLSLTPVAEARDHLGALIDELGLRHLSVACARMEVLLLLRRRLREEEKAEEEEETTEGWLLLLECALELWRTQKAVLGPLHPNNVQTLQDISAGLRSMLARKPSRLFASFEGLWETAAGASQAEEYAESLAERVAALYHCEL